jgi:probable F420-dependent oxidoreductase
MSGVHIPQEVETFPRYADMAGRLEASGFDRMWVGEYNQADAVSSATLAAVGTDTAQVGVFLNVFLRAPSALAMTGATLARLAPGRVQLALGVGSPLFVERWNGIPFTQTFSRLRDTLRFIRSALTGERVRDDFTTFTSAGFRLADGPEPPPELLIAATSPRSLRLAADEADGVVLNWITPAELDAVDPLPSDRRAITLITSVCPTTDFGLVDTTMRDTLANYFRIPAYADQLRRHGRADALAPMWNAWDAGDATTARAALPASLIDELVVQGDPASCRAQLDAIERETGARVVAQYFPPEGETFEDGALP